MGEIISNLSDLAIVISADEVESWTQEAGEILNEKIPRVADVEELMAIDYNEVMDEFKANRESSIDNFIHSTAQPCRLKGRPPEALRQYLKGYEDLEILIDLLSHGQRSFLHENFKANGGKRIRQSASYDRAEQLCHHACNSQTAQERSSGFNSVGSSDRAREIEIPFQPASMGSESRHMGGSHLFESIVWQK